MGSCATSTTACACSTRCGAAGGQSRRPVQASSWPLCAERPAGAPLAPCWRHSAVPAAAAAMLLFRCVPLSALQPGWHVHKPPRRSTSTWCSQARGMSACAACPAWPAAACASAPLERPSASRPGRWAGQGSCAVPPSCVRLCSRCATCQPCPDSARRVSTRQPPVRLAVDRPQTVAFCASHPPSFSALKVGWLTGPRDVVAAVAKAHQFLVFTVPSALQVGRGLVLLRNGGRVVGSGQLQSWGLQGLLRSLRPSPGPTPC